ncbi:MAG: AAA family ATPase, partial [Candidatus Promineifilaceae bacterium]
VHEPIPLVSLVNLALPAEVDTVLQKATAKRPNERYRDARTLSSAFRDSLHPVSLSPGQPVKSDQSRAPSLPTFLRGDRAEHAPTVFVGRKHEIERLNEFLGHANLGNGMVAFVAGDAGSGKTSLIGAFAQEAQEEDPELLVVQGSCNAFSGQGDPYLPFRDALRMLAGDVESRMASGVITRAQAMALWRAVPLTARTITQYGPNLVGTFVPGSGLLSRTMTAAPDDPALSAEVRDLVNRERAAQGDLEQGQLFEQVSEVLRAVAQVHPILLLLDDLQWADGGSINLLFHLGRRLTGSRILIVAAYRPEEVALGREGERHPLQPVLDEFKREFGDVWIDLNEIEGDEFVEAFLDSEPNRLSQKFRETLYQHTQGHALFTVELLRDLQEEGDLVKDEDGYWIESPSLEWQNLPARVEGVIEARIGRLEDELREILTVAAVEGENFTVQVVARVQQLQERRLLHTLSQELDRRHQLVRERQGLQLAGRYLSRYRFAHALFQRYLYNDISEGERRLLHGEVARILEELYEGRLEEITV